MKKIFLFSCLILTLSLASNAQINDLTGDHYTYGQLDKLGKLELSKIYVQEVQKLNRLVPYIPFNQKGDAVSLSGMGIPNSKDNNGAIKKLDTSGGSFNEALDSTLVNIIPYADKGDIIQAVLFLQNMIEKIETGI